MDDSATIVLIFLSIIAVFAIAWAIFENLGAAEEGTLEERERNPSLNTNDWDLHKNRLFKFGRSQYKGLTFFLSSEDRIYYLSDTGTKIYC